MDRAIEAVRAHRQESPGEIIDALLTQVREWSRTTQEDDMTVVAEFIDRAIHAKDDAGKLASIRKEVASFALKFPMPH